MAYLFQLYRRRDCLVGKFRTNLSNCGKQETVTLTINNLVLKGIQSTLALNADVIMPIHIAKQDNTIIIHQLPIFWWSLFYDKQRSARAMPNSNAYIWSSWWHDALKKKSLLHISLESWERRPNAFPSKSSKSRVENSLTPTFTK